MKSTKKQRIEKAYRELLSEVEKLRRYLTPEGMDRIETEVKGLKRVIKRAK